MYHPKMERVIADNELFGVWVKLCLLAIDRYAARQGDSFWVSDTDLCRITNRKRIDKALFTARKLAHNSPITLSSHGHKHLIGIPNFSKKQGFEQKNSTRTPAPEHREQNTNSSIQSSPDGWIDSLVEVMPGGVRYSREEVANWVAWIRPRVVLRVGDDEGTVIRTIGSWWGRATSDAVREAGEWVKVKALGEKRATWESESDSEDDSEDYSTSALFD
tara:strand:- start:248 stop:901 length:654 start_codon:yes stop_codon:yes gene_type:complete